MSQSINYYIQLSDEISNHIDSMSTDRLIELAHTVLDVYQKGVNNPKLQDEFWGTPFKNLPVLAHGLLAKAV